MSSPQPPASAKAEFIQKLWLVVIDRLAIGLVLVIVGWYASQRLEVFKSASAAAAERQREENAAIAERRRLDSSALAERVRERRSEIGRQLGEFYLPLQLHLAFDTAIWDAKLMYDPDKKYRMAIRTQVVLQNHLETLGLIMTRGSLMQNTWEDPNDATLKKFRDEILRYQRHVAIFKALAATGTENDPVSKREPFREDIKQVVDARIDSLTLQYKNAEQAAR